MQITPAILTSDLNLFSKLVKDLEFSHTLDVDIIRPPFVQNSTVQLKDVINLFDYRSQSIGFHLMVENPEVDLTEMLNSKLIHENLRIYLHQESNLEFLKTFDWPQNWQKCVAVKIESEFKDLDFYNQFEEVQLMSIETGKQGNPFNPIVLERVETLTKMGFFGKISLDGGINLETINLIKGTQVDRISVGSYFQKSQNVKESYRMLTEALEN